jgi:hypothetical protein
MPNAKAKSRTLTVLVSVYGVLAFAALGRSLYELVAKFSLAPFPYSLSAFSAMVYLVATLALARNTSLSNRVAVLAVSIELVGVLVVGLASILYPSLFSSNGAIVHSVWSYFGVSYGFVPVVLPVVGLVWLRRGAAK